MEWAPPNWADLAYVNRYHRSDRIRARVGKRVVSSDAQGQTITVAEGSR